MARIFFRIVQKYFLYEFSFDNFTDLIPRWVNKNDKKRTSSMLKIVELIDIADPLWNYERIVQEL